MNETKPLTVFDPAKGKSHEVDITPGVTPRDVLAKIGLDPNAFQLKREDQINFFGNDENLWEKVDSGQKLEVSAASIVATVAC